MAPSPVGASTEQKSSSSELEGGEQSTTVEQRLDRLEKAALWIKEFLISTARAPVHDGNGENTSSGFVTPSVGFVVTPETPEDEEKTLPLETIVEQPVKQTTPDTVDPLETELELQVSVDLAKGDVQESSVAEETMIPSLGNIIEQLVDETSYDVSSDFEFLQDRNKEMTMADSLTENTEMDLHNKGKSDLRTSLNGVRVKSSICGTEERCSASSFKADRIWEPGGLPIKPEMFETGLQGISKLQSPRQEETELGTQKKQYKKGVTLAFDPGGGMCIYVCGDVIIAEVLSLVDYSEVHNTSLDEELKHELSIANQFLEVKELSELKNRYRTSCSLRIRLLVGFYGCYVVGRELLSVDKRMQAIQHELSTWCYWAWRKLVKMLYTKESSDLEKSQEQLDVHLLFWRLCYCLMDVHSGLFSCTKFGQRIARFLIYGVFHFLRPPEQLQSKICSWIKGLSCFNLEDKVVFNRGVLIDRFYLILGH